MAQKLGLALVALLGLANAQVVVARGGVVTLLPGSPAKHGGLRHEDDSEDGNGPKLGHEVILGHAVVLGEKDDHDGHDDHDEGRSFGILNYANPVGHDDQESNYKKKGYHSDQEEEHDDKPKKKDSKRDSGKNDGKKHKDSSDNLNSKSYKEKGEKSHSDKGQDEDDSVRVNVKIIKVQAENKGADRKAHRKDDDSSHQHHEGDANDVYVPVFGKLKYVDTDVSGEATKAPITIVTAPLVSTAETVHHKVGINQVVGKPNCPECKEDEHEAKQTVKSANKALSKNVDKVSTNIKGPIDNVVANVEHTKVKKEKHDKYDDGEEDGYDRHGGAIIDQKRLKKQLAVGEARENAPFVVGAVKYTSSKNLSTQDDDHHEDDSCDDHNKKQSKRHD